MIVLEITLTVTLVEVHETEIENETIMKVQHYSSVPSGYDRNLARNTGGIVA